MSVNNWKNEQLVSFYNTNFEFTPELMQKYIEPLALTPDDVLIDFGCGNGALIDFIAPHVTKAVGIDISDSQLQTAACRLEKHQNAELITGNYLDLDLGNRLFTKGSARKTLHHLNDEDKFKFFANIGKSFAKDALFIIEDAVFDFKLDQFHANRDRIIEQAKVHYGPEWNAIKHQFYITLLEEYPTDFATWQAALEHGGFQVVQTNPKTCFMSTILARRVR